MRQYDIEDYDACQAELREMERRYPRITRRFAQHGESPADERNLRERDASLVRYLRKYPHLLRARTYSIAVKITERVFTGNPDPDLQAFVKYSGGVLLADRRLRDVVDHCKKLATSVELPNASAPQRGHDR